MSGESSDPGGGRSGKLVVLGVVWGSDGCSLRLRVPEEGSELVPAVGTELRFRVSQDPERHCVGHLSVRKNNGEYVDCPNRPRPNERVCVSCAVADAEFAASLHHAHTRDRSQIDEAVARHLDQANVLYLATFRDGSIKVGTSTRSRIERRLTEQGAWRAVITAAADDGIVVRRLEDLVTAELGLPQAVAVKRKVQGLVAPLDDRRLANRLHPLVERVHHLIADDAGAIGGGLRPMSDPWLHPSAEDDIWSNLHPYTARLDRGAHHIEILEMCGRVAVLSRPGGDDRFAADLSPLFGVELDMGGYEPDRLIVQDSLF